MKFKKFVKESIEVVDTKTTESLDDMDKRCEKCNTLLNDMGTCPKCDDGEEDVIEESLSNREKLLRAYPELNFDAPVTESCSEELQEEISVRERLKRAYPELNFDEKVTEDIERLKKAFPDDIKFDQENKVIDRTSKRLKKVLPDEDIQEKPVSEDWDEYDDDYDLDDDVELDRRHAALYGGNRMYCDCGRKLVMTEWGGYCPECNPEDPEDLYDDNF